MKRLALILAILLILTLVVGCNNTNSQVDNELENKESTDKEKAGSEMDPVDFAKYKGDWKIVVAVNEGLYLMTALEEYFGTTGINIVENNNGVIKGSIYSVQGAPSYRQAEVAFTGNIEDGKLRASYEDEGWEYTGNIELTFVQEKIQAKISRDEVDITPMWGIPEGEFTFVKPIETEKVNMTDEEKEAIEQFLFPAAKDRLGPFVEGDLTDEIIINFVGYNLALGFLDTSGFGDKVEEGVDIVFDVSVMDELAKKYFGVEIKEHKAVDITAYEKGKYTVPAVGGVSEYPKVRILLEDMQNKGIYYAIVDYMFEYPEDGEKMEYQRLIKMQKNNAYVVKEIQEIEYPIDFSYLNP
ncbi:MAG: hypothetical protein CVU87_00475 [Firmicutes bacterium HGW-Firmicutes-12]|nr:MAG: hypothetical protein CVU87_00475 [Firmicutes bacterium HGW-Firmicutes-12]